MLPFKSHCKHVRFPGVYEEAYGASVHNYHNRQTAVNESMQKAVILVAALYDVPNQVLC